MERKDWLFWRKEGVGSSDAPAIMGVSPWKSPLMVYCEKISKEIDETTNFAQDKGNEMEPKIRSLFMAHMGESFFPSLVMMEKYPFMRASLDGQSECKKKIVEIKLLGKEDWENAKKGIVPAKYWPQCQHQLLVSGADVCYFVGYLFEKNKKPMDTRKMVVIEVMPDRDYWVELWQMEANFWNRVQTKRPPPPSDLDIKEIKRVTLQAVKEFEESEFKMTISDFQKKLQVDIFKVLTGEDKCPM